MKKYPISIAKYDHTLMYLRDAAAKRDSADLAQEVQAIRDAMHQSSTDGRIGWLSGKTYERVKELAIMARSHQNAIYQASRKPDTYQHEGGARL